MHFNRKRRVELDLRRGGRRQHRRRQRSRRLVRQPGEVVATIEIGLDTALS
jgi:hypothetical protein